MLWVQKAHNLVKRLCQACGGGVVADAVFVCEVAGSLQRRTIISEQVVTSFALTILVMIGFALIIRLPSVAATSHQAE